MVDSINLTQLNSINLTQLNNWNECSCYFTNGTLTILGGTDLNQIGTTEDKPLIGGGDIPWIILEKI